MKEKVSFLHNKDLWRKGYLYKKGQLVKGTGRLGGLRQFIHRVWRAYFSKPEAFEKLVSDEFDKFSNESPVENLSTKLFKIESPPLSPEFLDSSGNLDHIALFKAVSDTNKILAKKQTNDNKQLNIRKKLCEFEFELLLEAVNQSEVIQQSEDTIESFMNDPSSKFNEKEELQISQNRKFEITGGFRRDSPRSKFVIDEELFFEKGLDGNYEKKAKGITEALLKRGMNLEDLQKRLKFCYQGTVAIYSQKLTELLTNDTSLDNPQKLKTVEGDIEFHLYTSGDNKDKVYVTQYKEWTTPQNKRVRHQYVTTLDFNTGTINHKLVKMVMS